MKLIGLKLKNFRCYKEEIYLSIDSFIAIIGCNDAGKSSILDALDIFLNDSAIDVGDVNLNGSKETVCITLIFSHLPEKIILDVDHPTSLYEEYLVNEGGNLEITKRYSHISDKLKPEGIYLYANYPQNESACDLHSLTNQKLKSRMKELDIEPIDIDQKINSQIRKKIWQSFPELNLSPRYIQIDKESKDIWEQIKRYLPIFALFKSDRSSTDQDSEAQDPMKAVIKETIKAENRRIQELTDSVKKQVMEVAQLTIEKIKEMSPSLANELNPCIEVKNAENMFKVSLTGDNAIPINKRGSGVRRLILLNFFRASTEKTINNSFSNVIYGIEEPETSQHPNNQKMLIRALMELAEDPMRQILITTHTPVLDGILPANALRYLQKCEDGTRCIHQGDNKTYELIVNALGVLPDNRVKLFIAIEGYNDINFLLRVSDILHEHNFSYPNLRQLLDRNELIFISAGGSNLQHQLINNVQALGRPEFHLYDRDTGDKFKRNEAIVYEINKRDKCKAVLTGKREIENYIHPSVIRTVFNIDIDFDDFTDVPILIAEKLHHLNSTTPWADLDKEKQNSKESKVKKKLCTECVERMSIQLLNEIDPNEDIKSWFCDIANLLDESDEAVITHKNKAITPKTPVI